MSDIKIYWICRKSGSRQRGASTCQHGSSTSIYAPALWVRGRYIGMVGPGIRQCCLDFRDERSLSAFWYEVDQRIENFKEGVGTPSIEIGRILYELRDEILDILEQVIPYPGDLAMREYEEWLKTQPARKRRAGSVPSCLVTLGLSSWPTDHETLHNHWKKLAFQNHPDRGGNTTDFIRIKRAYDEAKVKFQAIA